MSSSDGHLAQPSQPVAAPGRAVDDEPVGAGQQVARRPRCRTAARPATRPMTGRSWMISGVTIAAEVPARPRRRPSGGSSRHRSPGRPRAAGCSAPRPGHRSTTGRPGRPTGRRSSATDGARSAPGWSPRRARRAPGVRAMTTRFITLVRAAMWRPGSPSISAVRSGPGPDPGEDRLDLGDAVGPVRPAQDRLVERDRRSRRWSSIALRSGATAGPRGPAARRPRPGPTCRRRSSGSPARRTRPRRR